MKKFLLVFFAMCMIGTSAFGEITIPISAGYNDYEEHLDTGALDFGSTDLEMPYEDWDGDGGFAYDPQLVGLFFTDTGAISPGDTIYDAQVRFDVDSISKEQGTVNLLIRGVLGNGGPALSAKTLTTAVVQWSPTVAAATHEDKFTSDISAIVQEIIDMAGWTSGEDIGLIFMDDPSNPSAGVREYESFDGAGDNLDRIPTLLVTIPEPATMLLLGLGGLALRRRRRA